ncbi:MAG TPA: DUF2065 domain-containing protein [Acidiferrobacteraceae bacterium]|nr:MAG: hypothetical protein BMS9Abin11_0993 [Gammaproteobacteria bacterium]HDO78245.1 DUF2065 domain-containing protein [Acidiferrobacteraceae bacterium]HEX19242.1 DUF2065 domain-containing protein [Acidiferrobacteraceae bacterium]
MWKTALTAIALLLILEGLIPFISPDAMRKYMQKIQQMNDQKLRFAGLTAMVAGVLMLFLVR